MSHRAITSFTLCRATRLLDRLELKVKAEDTDLTLNDDMSRPEYIKQMTPEQQKALEEYKKKNAAVTSANQVIAKLNATLKTVRADLAAAAPTKGDVSKDVAMMKEAVAAKPDTGLLWLTYGDTLLAQGRHLAEADKKSGTTASSDDGRKPGIQRCGGCLQEGCGAGCSGSQAEYCGAGS